MSGTGRRGGFNPLIAGFIAGAVAIVILGLLAKINLDLAAPWSKTHTLTAAVTDADGISVSSDVRIAGRAVGQITKVESKGTFTDVTFHVDDANWPLPVDTTAQVRLATLLGQKYIQLTPGTSKSQALADDATIGLPSTSSVVDFDQILNTFDKPTRDSLTGLIRTAGAAVNGQEGTLQQLIPDLSSLSVHSVTPTQELSTRDPQINNILVNLGITADQLNQSGNDLAGVVTNMNSITGALANNQHALEGYITNTDTINVTTDQVLGGAGAPQLNAAFLRLGSFATQLDTLMNHLLPETRAFATDHSVSTGQLITNDAKNLVFQIGSATSQGNLGGYFLRQNANGNDACGLLGPTCAIPAGPKAGSAAGTPVCVPVPGVPCVTVPITIPPLPAPVPTPPVPTPTPQPVPTLPPIGISPLTSYNLPAATDDPLVAWGWL